MDKINFKFYDGYKGVVDLKNPHPLENNLKFFIVSKSNEDYFAFVKRQNLSPYMVFWCSTEKNADRDIAINVKKGISCMKIILDK
jgi:hypothetical protein